MYSLVLAVFCLVSILTAIKTEQRQLSAQIAALIIQKATAKSKEKHRRFIPYDTGSYTLNIRSYFGRRQAARLVETGWPLGVRVRVRMKLIEAIETTLGFRPGRLVELLNQGKFFAALQLANERDRLRTILQLISLPQSQLREGRLVSLPVQVPVNS